MSRYSRNVSRKICRFFQAVFTPCSTSPRTNRLMFLRADIVKVVPKTDASTFDFEIQSDGSENLNTTAVFSCVARC